MKRVVLGISAFYHDSAACILCDGKVVAAAQEERFSRIKGDAEFPKSAIKYCVDYAQIDASEIEAVVFYEKPLLKFERLLETYFALVPHGFKSFSKSMPLWVKDKLFQKQNIVRELSLCFGDSVNWEKKLFFSEHHLSHLSSAFFPSPFNEAAILALDGVGEWPTVSIGLGKRNRITIEKEIMFPHSLGLLYSSFTSYLGFKVNSGEYKVMGLAPYGEPKYADLIKEKLINIAEDGSFHLNMSYFDYPTGLSMTNKKFDKLFGFGSRNPETELRQKHMDLAASVQKVTEEVILKLVRHVSVETGQRNLCLAGGVALNCVANGLILKSGYFDNVWVQPASGDAGGALGAALAFWHMCMGKERSVLIKKDGMNGAYLGPSFSSKDIQSELNACGAKYSKFTKNELIDKVASLLAQSKAVGWFQGRMEFGPRALGCRSILADPRSPIMQKQLNLKVKFRESFRPFAPSVLRQDLADWFELDIDSPYMLFVSNIKKNKQLEMSRAEMGLFGIDKLNVLRSQIPAVTHVDYTARVQTVHKSTNRRFHSLLTRFKELTGCPILINTSFNIRGEPIVCSPSDAFRCFMGTDLDVLVIGDFILQKEDQNDVSKKDYRKSYELD